MMYQVGLDCFLQYGCFVYNMDCSLWYRPTLCKTFYGMLLGAIDSHMGIHIYIHTIRTPGHTQTLDIPDDSYVEMYVCVREDSYTPQPSHSEPSANQWCSLVCPCILHMVPVQCRWNKAGVPVKRRWNRLARLEPGTVCSCILHMVPVQYRWNKAGVPV